MSTVAYKRFVDMVPMAIIDHEIVLRMRKGIDMALQITRPDAYDRCRIMLEEPISAATTHWEMQEKMERLQAARQELRRLM